MFGFGTNWKKTAEVRQALLNDAIDDVVNVRRQLRQVQDKLAAADFPLQVERAKVERLTTLLSAADVATDIERERARKLQAGLDHATHCYEQCEADRQAIAKERDEARAQGNAATAGALEQRDSAIKERDEWRETAEQASATTARIIDRCHRFITDLSKLRNEPDASDPDPADHVADCDGSGGCPGCVHLGACLDAWIFDPAPDEGPDHAAIVPFRLRREACPGVDCSCCRPGPDAA